jgi:hypothetical protein
MSPIKEASLASGTALEPVEGLLALGFALLLLPGPGMRLCVFIGSQSGIGCLNKGADKVKWQ